MKKLLLLMLLAPSLAWGQSTTYDGQTFKGSLQFTPTGGIVRADSTGRMQAIDVNGNAYYIDGAPDRTVNYFEHAVTQRTLQTPNARTVASGGLPRAFVSMDSSGVIDTQGWNHMGVLFNWALDDSVATYAIALQMRTHPTCSGDSISFYPWSRVLKPGTATAGAVDTVGSMFTAALTQAGWDTLATSNEIVVLLDQTPGQAPGKKFVMLDDAWGAFFAGHCSSIRIRYLNAFGTTALLPYGDSTANVGAADTADPWLTITADLVGWR